jgi:D-3-phosphoglycerate dehydrogenase / 2-oxoglutarate reductase
MAAEDAAATAPAPAEPPPWQVALLNDIAPAGLALLPTELYRVHGTGAGPIEGAPHALLLRSADLHARELPDSVLAVARAGAGTNNIPVDRLSARGVPVFNTPGANANAVKELVLAGMLMAAREIGPALRFVAGLDPEAGGAAGLSERVEAGKKAFAGVELQGRTLGVIGLGRVGCAVAEVGIRLGMQVLGHDPEITVDAAWSLPSKVRRAASVAEVFKGAQFVSLHVPLMPATHGLVGAALLAQLPPGAVLLNFSREAVVDEAAVLQALQAGRLAQYVSDFPSGATLGHPRVLALPHLGASTAEAEENCAVMAVRQLRSYLEAGEISHALNFPPVQMARESAWRLAIANANVPNMLGQISTALAQAGLNIENMLNKSRGEMAYTLVDVDRPVPTPTLQALRGIGGVLAVRSLPEAR